MTQQKNKEFNKFEIINTHINILWKYYSENFINGHIRKHILWYLKGEKDCSMLKVKVSTEQPLDRVIEMLKNYFDKENI